MAIDYWHSAKVLIRIGARLIKSSISESKFKFETISEWAEIPIKWFNLSWYKCRSRLCQVPARNIAYQPGWIVLILVECRSFEWKCRNWFLDEQQFIWKFLTFCRHLTCFSNFVSFVLPWWIRVTRGKTVLVIKALWMQEMCRNNKASDFLKTTHRQSWFFQT